LRGCEARVTAQVERFGRGEEATLILGGEKWKQESRERLSRRGRTR